MPTYLWCHENNKSSGEFVLNNNTRKATVPWMGGGMYQLICVDDDIPTVHFRVLAPIGHHPDLARTVSLEWASDVGFTFAWERRAPKNN